MTVSFQVTFDCTDPNRLAAFWAMVLDYKLEDPPPGFSTWEEWLVANHVPEDQWNTRAAIVDPQGKGARFWFQKVPEPKTAKNRVHLDLRVGDRNMPPEEMRAKARAKIDQMVAAGAKILYEMSEFGSNWSTLADPEGNEFCIGY